MDLGLAIIGLVALVCVGFACYKIGFSRARSRYRDAPPSGGGGGSGSSGGRAPIRE